MMADFILSITMLNNIVNCKYMMYLPMISNIYTALQSYGSLVSVVTVVTMVTIYTSLQSEYGLKFSNCVWVVYVGKDVC